MAMDWKAVGKYTGVGLTLLIAFVAALFAGCAITYGWGKDVGLGEIERTRGDLARSNQALANARSEVANLKVQFASAQKVANSIEAKPVTSPGDKASAGNPFVPKLADSSDLRVTIKEGSSQELFDGDLTVSVIGIDYCGTPLRDRIDMTALAGGASRKLTSADVGQQLRVGKYVVTVLALITIEATLRVKAT